MTEYADLYDTNDVRVMTTDGQLVSYTEYGQRDQDAWDAFTEAVQQLQTGEIAQLITDDLIAAEHNPEYHGTTALDAADYA